MVHKIQTQSLDPILVYSRTTTEVLEEKEINTIVSSDEDTENGNSSTNDDASASANGTTSTSSNPSSSSVLPPGYGAAIVMAFLAMIEYLQQVVQQSYETTQDSVKAMIGTNGQNGMIANWVKEGIESADQSKRQFKAQAIGALIGAAFSAAAVLGSAGGFMRNNTDGIGQGKFQTEKGVLNEQLSNARNYRNMLEEMQNPEVEAGSSQSASVNGDIEMQEIKGKEKEIELDAATQQRKKELMDGVGIDRYQGAKKGSFSAEDIETRKAASHLRPDERAAAIEKAQKRIENLEGQIGTFDTKQNILASFLQQGAQAGTGIGNYYGGVNAGDATAKSGIAKAQSEVEQQASQTAEKVTENSNSSLQSNREMMSQMAQTMAQALQSQVQDKG